MRFRSKWPLIVQAVGFAALDQASKWLVQSNLRPGESIALIPGVFQLTLTYNTGAAFSMLNRHTGLLTVISMGVMAILLAYGLSRPRFMRGERLGLSLIIGGALGNLIDRLLHGKVTDFLDVIAIHYPVFNIADSFIFCGVALLIWGQLRGKSQE